MSILISRTQVDQVKIKEISSRLHIQETQKFFRTPNFYYHQTPPPKYVNLYLANTDFILLPYQFALELYPQACPLAHLYPRVSIQTKIKPRPEQVSILTQVADHLDQQGTANLNVYTGCGKTMMAIFLACQYRMLTCIVCTSKPLITQWSNVIKNFTNASPWIIGQKPPSEVNIVLTMVSGLEKIDQEFRKQLGMLIIDEAHTFCTQQRSLNLLLVQPAYVLSLTATPERPDKMNAINLALTGAQAVIRKMPKPYIIYEVQTGILPPKKMNRNGTTNWDAITKELFKNPLRNQLILQVVKTYPTDKILILTTRVEHANFLAKQLKEQQIPVSSYLGSDQTYEEKHVLIGTISKIGTGFDESNICQNYSGKPINIIILCLTMRSPIQTVQALGRATRADAPRAFILVDEESIVQSQFKTMKRTIRKDYLQPQFKTLNRDYFLGQGKAEASE